MTIPKKMLPLRLALFKQMLLWNKTLTPASASSTASAFTDSPAASPKPWGPSFSIPSRAGSSTATVDVELPMSTPAAPATPTDEASDIAIKVQSNIVLAPQRVDSPVTKPNKPDGGVPLAQPVDVKALEQQRRQGLKPGKTLMICFVVVEKHEVSFCTHLQMKCIWLRLVPLHMFEQAGFTAP